MKEAVLIVTIVLSNTAAQTDAMVVDWEECSRIAERINTDASPRMSAVCRSAENLLVDGLFIKEGEHGVEIQGLR